MAFRFSLATVLRVRESAERREELHLQKALAEIARVNAAIDHETQRIEDARRSRDAALKQAQPAIAYQMQSFSSEAEAATARKKVLQEELIRLEQHRRAQMKSYEIAHRDRQMLSDMSAEQRDAYELNQSRSEQKVLDDIFASRSRLE